MTDAAGRGGVGRGPVGGRGVWGPHGLMELRPGAPDSAHVGLLFVVEPQDTAVLVVWVADPGGPLDAYQEVMQAAAARLAVARSAPPATAASPADFVSYDAESFLDEFFPG